MRLLLVAFFGFLVILDPIRLHAESPASATATTSSSSVATVDDESAALGVSL
jgi:hypothetical protein